jgi:branched-chain amino acid transport system substrate-binding protein
MKTFDDPVKQGMQLAISQINATGGVGGRKLKLITADAASDQSKSRSAGQQLLDAGADFVVPSCDYNIGGPAAQAAGQKNVLAIGCAGGPLFGKTGLGPYVFNTFQGSPTEGSTLAQFAIQKGWKTAYLIDDTSLAYTDEICKNFTKRFPQLGGKVLGSTTMQNSDTSIASQISKVEAAKPQVVLLCSYPLGGVTALRQIRSSGVKTPVLGTGSFDGTYWVKSVPRISDFYIAAISSRAGDDPSPTVKKFFTDFEAATGTPATSALYPMSGYESVETIAKGIEKAGGKTDGPSVAKALETFKDEPLLMGKTTYTSSCHIPIGRTMEMLGYVNGKEKYLESITPSEVLDKTC